jgi:hypothetical protein
MVIRRESKNKKGMTPKMVLRLFDPRDDRTAGEEEDDGFEQTSPLIVKQIPRNKAKEVK